MRGCMLLAFGLGLLALLHQFLLASLEALAPLLELTEDNGRVGRLLAEPVRLGVTFAELCGKVAYLAVAFEGGFLLEDAQGLQLLTHVLGTRILGMGHEGVPRHVLGVRADALENLLTAGDEALAAGLVDTAEFVEFARLVLDAGGDVVRFVLHQRIDCGLGVRREARRGRQALQLVGKLLDAPLVFRLVGLRRRKGLLRLCALDRQFRLARGLRGRHFVEALQRLSLLGFDRGALGHDGGHPRLGRPRRVGGLLGLAPRLAHTRLRRLQRLLQAFDLLAERRRLVRRGRGRRRDRRGLLRRGRGRTLWGAHLVLHDGGRGERGAHLHEARAGREAPT